MVLRVLERLGWEDERKGKVPPPNAELSHCNLAQLAKALFNRHSIVSR